MDLHVDDRSPLSLLNLSASTRGRLSAAMCSGHTHARRLCIIIFYLFPSRLSVGRDAGGCCAGVPSVFALEGGYNIPVNSSSCEAVLRVLLGEAPPKRLEARLSRSCEDTLRAVMQVMREPSHADTWSALYFFARTSCFARCRYTRCTGPSCASSGSRSPRTASKRQRLSRRPSARRRGTRRRGAMQIVTRHTMSMWTMRRRCHVSS